MSEPFQDSLRTIAAKETLAWLQPKLKMFGITRVANISGLDDLGIFVTTCIRPNSKHLSVAQGKGLSLELAQISAIMEAIEAYHIENPKAPALQGSYTALKDDYPLIDPGVFPRSLFSKNLQAMPLAWTRALEYNTQKPYYLPHILSCIDSTKIRSEYALFNVSSNGLAAGNSFNEALAHALLEVIEREALFHWQILTPEAKQARQIDILTIDDANHPLIEQLLQKGIEIKLWDISSGIGIPAFHCALIDHNPIRSLPLFTGTAAHLSKTIAVSKALTEALQGRLTYISGSRDDVFDDYYLKLKLDFMQHPPLKTPAGTKKYAACLAENVPSTLAGLLEKITARLTANGFTQILIIDHYKKELSIPVVQVFVPGLRLNNARM